MKPKTRSVNNRSKAASPRQPQTPNSKPLRLEHGRDFKLGRPIGQLLMPGIAGFYWWPDSSLFQFITKFIAENGVCLPDDEPTPAQLDLAECVIIARVVRKTPSAESFTFPLPGLAAHRAMTADEVLHYLADLWTQHREEWKRLMRVGPLGAFERAQMDVVCETILVRAGTLEEMDYNTPSHRAAARHYAEALKTAWSTSAEI